MIDVEQLVRQAERRIRPHVRETFVEHSAHFSRLGGAEVFFKLENLQHTGSFKVRGALSKLLALTDEERSRGIVAASTGNHGAAVAFALERLGAPGLVFVPEGTAPGKLRAIEERGVEVRHVGQDSVEAERYAREYAAGRGKVYVSPYNDPEIVGGQGTIGVELERQLERIDVLFASVGGGGLVSGIAGYLKASRPDLRVIGCSPENSPVMQRSIEAGKILDLPSRPTLSDGTAGGVEADAITFETCRELVDEFQSVTESEIAEALRRFLGIERMLIEGAAAVALASYLKLRERFAGAHVVVVLCGGNIDVEVLKSVL